ncbi:EKC/KEOPS complex subunit GON7-like [Xyrichtys novacula]|nr:EKC/KEOPS complex subunit GON7-like [Xyrichtys novacula]
MAAVTAELVFRDGQKENISVKVENNLKSLIGGIHELNTNVSRLLTELVEQEKSHGVCAEGEEDDSDEEDEESEEPQNSDEQPPVKRSRS